MPVARLIPLFGALEILSVTIVSPTSGETITNSAPVITWSFSPGTQQSFRVRIATDAFLTDVIYDSGTVVSAVQQHTVPSGNLLSTTTYYVFVNIETTTNQLGESEVVQFDTSFAPSVEIDDATARTANDDCDTAGRTGALPQVIIGWGEVTPAGDETFVRYSIWRRARHHPRHPDADSAWERIGSVTAVATTIFTDYCAAAYVVYEYAVTWTAQAAAGDLLVSSRQSIPPNVRLEFDRVYLHDVLDPTNFAVWTPDSVTLDSGQEVTLRNVWGRPAPTPLIGEFAAHVLRLNSLPDLHRGQVWTQAAGLQQQQGDAGATICCRLGYAGERYFGIVTAPNRSDALRQYTASLEFAETHYEETVS